LEGLIKEAEEREKAEDELAIKTFKKKPQELKNWKTRL
jgi:hypothetical protein